MDKNSAGRPDQRGEPWFDPYDQWLGIPAKEQPPNHYRLLGVSIFEANLELIDAAANRQVAYLESCATGMRVLLAQRLLDDIAAARLCLLNPARKATYDAALERSQQKRPKPNPVCPVDKPGRLPPLSNGAPRGNSGIIGVLVGAALVVAGVTGGILFIGRNRPVEKQTAELDITNGPPDRHALEVPPAKTQAAEPDIAKGIDTDAIKPIPEVSKKASIATPLDLATEKPDSPVAHGIGATTPEYHPSVLGEQVEQAIRDGVRYLKRIQHADGTWAEPEKEALTGGTSLATLALLAAGQGDVPRTRARASTTR